MRSVLVAIVCASSCTATIAPATSDAGPTTTGEASYYADSLAGRSTASGEPYDPAKDTCAHRKLPLGTALEVKAVKTGKVARCVVNDRGPYAKGRILDVSRAVAVKLEMLELGVIEVELRPVQP